MKNSPLTSILLAILAISAVWSIISCAQYNNNTRQFRRLQNQVANIQLRQSAFQALVADTTEYGKTHPKIDPILESIGYKRNAAGASATPTK
jgi:type II secretory pathway component PulJ